MTPTIGDKIVRFTGNADADNQIPYHALIDNITDRAIKIDKYSLKTFLDRSFRIPDYQRGYEWDEENWTELWDEIAPLFDAEEQSAEPSVNDVFFGSMFFAESDTAEAEDVEGDLVYDIIDGQQRITTLTIFFKILSDKVQECIEADTDLISTLGDEPGNIRNLVYEDTSAGAEKNPSLTLNRHNKEFFNYLMRGQDAQLKYLLTLERVHGNTKYDAITVKDYLEKAGIPKSEYLAAVDDDEMYNQLEDETKRPNLTATQVSELESAEADDLTPTSDLGKELLSNKVELKEANQSLLEANEFFTEKLNDQLEDLETPREKAFALVNAKNFVVYMFHVGYFEVQRDQPRLLMKIFEILNDRGVELKKADVMRTRIVARFRGEPNEDEYIRKWENVVSEFGNERIIDFLRTYFVVQGEANSRGDLKNHLLEAFVRNPNGDGDRKLESRLASVDDAEDFLDDLTTYTEYYHDITDPNNRGITFGEDGDEELAEECTRIITRLYNAKTSIWEPIVLASYHDIREGEIGKQNKLVKLLRAIESMAIRKFAVMDTHTRDRAYAAVMNEYHEEGISGDLVDTLTDIESDDPRAVGEPLVESLCQADWRKQWGKQVLRKIVSENFADSTDEIVLRELNLNESLVHLEHIFPQSPFLEDQDDEKYVWFKKFFKTGDETDISKMVSRFIENEDDDTLEEIADKYIRDLGNLALLRSKENIATGNQLFDQKAIHYLQTDGFCELHSSQFLCEDLLAEKKSSLNEYARLEEKKNVSEDKWESEAEQLGIDATSYDEFIEELNERQDDIAEEVEGLADEWTYDAVTQNRAFLVEAICDSIAFTDDEFNHVDFRAISEEETETMNEIITANYRRRL